MVPPSEDVEDASHCVSAPTITTAKRCSGHCIHGNQTPFSSPSPFPSSTHTQAPQSTRPRRLSDPGGTTARSGLLAALGSPSRTQDDALTGLVSHRLLDNVPSPPPSLQQQDQGASAAAAAAALSTLPSRHSANDLAAGVEALPSKSGRAGDAGLETGTVVLGQQLAAQQAAQASRDMEREASNKEALRELTAR